MLMFFLDFFSRGRQGALGEAAHPRGTISPHRVLWEQGKHHQGSRSKALTWGRGELPWVISRPVFRAIALSESTAITGLFFPITFLAVGSSSAAGSKPDMQEVLLKS